MSAAVHEMPIGDINIDQYLPQVFTDGAIRTEAALSLETFSLEHGQLPIKLRIEEFCFQRTQQICTADSPNKYLAWSAKDPELTTSVLALLSGNNLPVVLRSHPLELGTASPTLQITSTDQLNDYLGSSKRAVSDIENEFMGKLDPDSTVIELLKNPYLQQGLFLLRPTFVYDQALRRELLTNLNAGPQANETIHVAPGLPEALVGIRVLSLIDIAREKKQRLGTFFAYDPVSGNLEPKAGLPLEAKRQMDSEFSDKRRSVIGRTLGLEDGTTLLHYADGVARVTPDSIFINQTDITFLQGVLRWQLPRIVGFEEEIRQQDWIPQGITNTHQLVVLPPQDLDHPAINTQYFDFHPHVSVGELRTLAAQQGLSFDTMSATEKLTMFY